MTTGRSTGRIDVHQHYLPGFYREAARAAGHGRPDGMPALPDWSEDTALELMDALGISAALLSVSSPGVHFGDDAEARKLARRVNDLGAELVRARPTRFGLLASLPLPDIDGATAEALRALDDLGADGVVLESNAHGHYLGERSLDPLLAELDARAAVVLIHPTSPPCWQQTALDRPRPMIEFLFDTTRTVVDLVLSGSLERHPRVRWIVPHAGAVLPLVVDRVRALAGGFGQAEASPRPPDTATALSRLYYDLAGFAVPHPLRALLAIAQKSHLLYGSDWPFTPTAIVTELATALDATPLLQETDRADMYRNTALELFPRLLKALAEEA